MLALRKREREIKRNSLGVILNCSFVNKRYMVYNIISIGTESIKQVEINVFKKLCSVQPKQTVTQHTNNKSDKKMINSKVNLVENSIE